MGMPVPVPTVHCCICCTGSGGSVRKEGVYILHLNRCKNENLLGGVTLEGVARGCVWGLYSSVCIQNLKALASAVLEISQSEKVGHVTPPPTLFDLICMFLLGLLALYKPQYLKSVAPVIPEIRWIS